jgi:hypothetical protein
LLAYLPGDSHSLVVGVLRRTRAVNQGTGEPGCPTWVVGLLALIGRATTLLGRGSHAPLVSRLPFGNNASSLSILMTRDTSPPATV